MGMLILTRRVGETVMLTAPQPKEDTGGGQKPPQVMTVTILGVKGNQVRLGIDAPRDVTVDREEVYERKLREQADAKRTIQSREGRAGDTGQPKGDSRRLGLGKIDHDSDDGGKPGSKGRD